MTRLRMNNCDEVNHDGVRYPVSNSHHGIGMNEVEVPEHVARVLLSVSAGAVRVEDDPEPKLTKCQTCGHLRKE